MVLREVTVKMVGSNMLSIEGYAAGFDVTFGPLAFVQRHASYAQCLGQPSWLCPCRRHDYHSALVMNLCPLVLRCGFTNCPFYVVASFCRNHKTLYLLRRCQGGPTRQESCFFGVARRDHRERRQGRGCRKWRPQIGQRDDKRRQPASQVKPRRHNLVAI
jgi:hypothetical protein